MNDILGIIRPVSAYQEYLDAESRVDQVEISAQDERLEAEVADDMEQQDRDNVRADTDPYIAILCLTGKAKWEALQEFKANEFELSIPKGLR